MTLGIRKDQQAALFIGTSDEVYGVAPPIASGAFAPPGAVLGAAYSYATAGLFTGGSVYAYGLVTESADPSAGLPDGLSLNVTTGAITGTPTTTGLVTGLAVSGSNADGSDTTNFADIDVTSTSSSTVMGVRTQAAGKLYIGLENEVYSFTGFIPVSTKMGTRIFQGLGKLLLALAPKTYTSDAPNDPTLVIDQTYDVQGSPSVVAAPGLLTGATFTGLVSIDIEAQPADGVVVLDGLTGGFTVTHNTPANLPSVLSFTFNITDVAGVSNTATCTVNMAVEFVELQNLIVDGITIDQVYVNRVEVDQVYVNGTLVFDMTGDEPPVEPPVEPPSDYGLLQDIVNGMAVGDWYEIPDTVIPLTNAAEISAIEAETGGTPMWGVSGPRAAIRAWCGSATNGTDKWWFTGGGHADYGGNEFYEFNLATLTWKRLMLPEGLTDDILVGTTGKAPPVGRAAIHTYDSIQYNHKSKTIWFLRSKNAFTTVDYGSYDPARFYEFNPETLEWKYYETTINGGYAVTCWDPIEEKIAVSPRAYDTPGGFFIDEFAQTSKLNTRIIGPELAVGVYNALNQSMLYVGPGGNFDLREINLATDPVGNATTVFTTPQEFMDAYINDNGVAYDLSTDEVVFYPTTGKDVFVYNQDASGTMTHLDNAAGSVTPQNANRYSLSKFVYHEPTNCFLLYNHELYGVFVYKKEESTQLAYRFEFADIPEQVFVAGYTESEDMNLYCLDTGNLYPTGKLPWIDGTVFVPSVLVDVDGTLPTGVTWDRTTGKFTYDGSAIGPNEIVSVRFHEPVSNKYSAYFEVKLLEPTIEWSFADAGIPFETAVTDALAANTRTENVVLVKNGDYSGEALKVGGDAYLQSMENKGNIYLIGEPGSMPIISGYKTDNWADEYDTNPANWTTRCYLRFHGNAHVHMKNIDTRWTTTYAPGPYMVYNKVIARIHLEGATYQFTEYGKIFTGDTEDKHFFVSNFLTYHLGHNGQTHPIYGHQTQQDSEDPFLGFYGHSYLNNYVAYECRSVNSNAGGHVYKDMGDYVTIRNSWLSLSKDPAAPDFERAGEMHTSLHAHQRAVLYNNDFYTFYDENTAEVPWGNNARTLLFQPRNVTDCLAANQPSYFSWPSIRTATLSDHEKSGWGCWENWSGDDAYGAWQSTKNPVYHGDNVAPYNYSTTGDKGDVTANPVAPSSAPFWDTIGDVSDGSNANAYWKFVSQCRFHTITTPTPTVFQHNCISSRTSAPFTTDGLDDKSFLPVPSNWVERTWLHVCNNSWDQYFEELYNLDFQEPIGVDYAYGKSDTAASTQNNITRHGGDIKDGIGSNVAIPDNFKI